MNKTLPRLITFFGLAALFVWLVVSKLPDNNLHVIFCNVGQGDATLITYRTTQILIDGGPDNRVLDCLSQFMPILDKQIEVVYLTHPQADHATGLIEVIRRYNVSTFITTPLNNSSATMSTLEQALEDQEVPVQLASSDLVIRQGLIYLDTVWPTPEYLSQAKPDTGCLAESHAGNKVLGCLTPSSDLNDYSLIVLLKFDNFAALFPGDADSHIQDQVLSAGQTSPVEVLKLAHHGSKTGASTAFLKALQPKLAIISVGKNSYGHPSPQTLDQLKTLGIRTLRTDEQGSIEITTNGKSWWLNQ